MCDGVVDIWTVNLDRLPQDWVRHFRVLDAKEVERGYRFRQRSLARRFWAAHTALRIILARYLDCEPAEIRFALDGLGKPHVVDAVDLFFNMSHSDGVALIGVSGASPLGVDIEVVRPIPEAMAIVAEQFGPAEASLLRRADADVRNEVFLKVWTLIEAVLKGKGTGLTAGLRSVRVREGRGGLIASFAGFEARSVRAGRGITAALAVERPCVLRRRSLGASWV